MKLDYRNALLLAVLAAAWSADASALDWETLQRALPDMALPWDLLLLGVTLAVLGRLRPLARRTGG